MSTKTARKNIENIELNKFLGDSDNFSIFVDWKLLREKLKIYLALKVWGHMEKWSWLTIGNLSKISHYVWSHWPE